MEGKEGVVGSGAGDLVYRSGLSDAISDRVPP